MTLPNAPWEVKMVCIFKTTETRLLLCDIIYLLHRQINDLNNSTNYFDEH